MKITATYQRKYLFKGDPDDSRPEYHLHAFTNATDEKGKTSEAMSIKDTKLMQEVPFKKGTQYTISMHSTGAYPVEVSWGAGKEKVYMKSQNSIIKVDSKGAETNMSANTPNNYFWQMIRDSKKKTKKK